MIEIILLAGIGFLTGIITGITPGIHINLVCAILLSFSGSLLQFISPLALCSFIVSVAITHVFVDMVPSTFLGAPNADTALSVLPAHKLLMQGRGFEAIRLGVIGAFISFLVGLFFIPVALLSMPFLEESIKPYLGVIIIIAVIILILTERIPKRIFWASSIFLFSGVLGMLTLDSTINDPLLPLLSGAFGIAMLITAIREDSCIPPQYETEEIPISGWRISQYSIISVIAGSLTALLPGIGASQGVALAGLILPTTEETAYIIIVAGVGIINFVFSIVTLVAIGKARNGAIVAVQELMPSFTASDALILMVASLLVACLSVFATFFIARIFTRLMPRIDYQKSCFCVLIFCVTLVWLLNGIPGLFILLLSTCVGLLTHTTGIKKTHAMGCLLLPVIVRSFSG